MRRSTLPAVLICLVIVVSLEALPKGKVKSGAKGLTPPTPSEGTTTASVTPKNATPGAAKAAAKKAKPAQSNICRPGVLTKDNALDSGVCSKPKEKERNSPNDDGDAADAPQEAGEGEAAEAAQGVSKEGEEAEAPQDGGEGEAAEAPQEGEEGEEAGALQEGEEGEAAEAPQEGEGEAVEGSKDGGEVADALQEGGEGEAAEGEAETADVPEGEKAGEEAGKPKRGRFKKRLGSGSQKKRYKNRSGVPSQSINGRWKLPSKNRRKKNRRGGGFMGGVGSMLGMISKPCKGKSCRRRGGAAMGKLAKAGQAHLAKMRMSKHVKNEETVNQEMMTAGGFGAGFAAGEAFGTGFGFGGF